MKLTDKFCETFGVESTEQLERICASTTRGGADHISYLKRWQVLSRPGAIQPFPSTCAARILYGITGSPAKIEEMIVGGIAAMLVGDDSKTNTVSADDGRSWVGNTWPPTGNSRANGQWHRSLVYYGAVDSITDEMRRYGFQEVAKFNNPTGAANLKMMVLTL